MNNYGFELTAEEATQYEENRAAVDAEFEALVRNEQNTQLEAGALGISDEKHRALFSQALANVASGNKTEPQQSEVVNTAVTPANNEGVDLQDNTANRSTGESRAGSKTTSYTSQNKSAKGK